MSKKTPDKTEADEQNREAAAETEANEAARTEEESKTLAEQIEQNREAAAEAEADRPAEAPLADVTDRPVVDLGRKDLEQFPSSVAAKASLDLPVDSPSLATMTDRITAEHAVRAAEDTVTDPATGALTVEDPETDILADPASHPDFLASRGKAVTEGPPARSEEPAVRLDSEEDDGSVTFVSERHPSLIAFDSGGSLVGQFQDGRFTTSDPAAISALDALEGVERG